MKLLLHTCCGPCFLGVWEDLKSSGLDITNYYYNPNIHPAEEHAKRLEALKSVVAGVTQGLVIADYEPAQYAEVVKGYEADFPGRCLHCYRLRLEKVADYAKKQGFEAFSTTLLVSPYQQHEELRLVGEEIGLKHGVSFYYQDWRPFFREGQNEAKASGLYRQKYCGCQYSIPEHGS